MPIIGKKPELNPQAVKRSQSTNRGKLHTTKSFSGFVWFASLRDEGALSQLIHDPNCSRIESQSITIPNINPRMKPYIPDIYAEFKDGTKYVYDVKDNKYFEDLKLKKNEQKAINWENRRNCVKSYCKKHGFKYQIITEDEIWRERYDNVELLKKNRNLPDKFSLIQPEIVSILKSNTEMSRINLAIEISKKLELDKNEVIPTIDHLIYMDFFLLDFETEIDPNTILILRLGQKSKILPLYKYFLKVKENANNQEKDVKLLSNPKTEKRSIKEIKNIINWSGLTPKQKEETFNRLEYIKIFETPGINTKELEEFAKKNDISLSSLYRYKEAHDKLDWAGLVPEFKKKGRRKGSNAELEKLMKLVIYEHYLTPNQPTKMGSYNFLVDECLARKPPITPPHYKTFCSRINEIPLEERIRLRKGTKVFRDKFRPLTKKHPYGNHPLDVIEFDHTQLDIILADRILGIPVGRPWLTLAIDIYSRMIYGYYLSFDNPSILTVGMCFLTGILNKDHIKAQYNTTKDWPIYGLPKRIILDNALEFQSEALSDFCKLYGIDMQFNPPKKPERKPYVERMFKTINETMRDYNMPGYTPKIESRRETGFNPEKNDLLTIEGYEKWLVHWIIDIYHQRIHTGIKKQTGLELSPYIRYQTGLSDSNGQLIGEPTMPKNIEQLKFDVLPKETRQLHRYGIQIWNLEYYAPIIDTMRANLINPKSNFLLKYDPRDIREIYLWVDNEVNNDTLKGYYPIPLKFDSLNQIAIDITNPLDVPISKKELDLIKKAIKEERPLKKSRINGREISEQRRKSRAIIDEEIKKMKTRKKAAKKRENDRIYKEKGTSTEIRKDIKKKSQSEVKTSNSTPKKKIDIEELKSQVFPSRSLARRKTNRR